MEVAVVDEVSFSQLPWHIGGTNTSKFVWNDDVFVWCLIIVLPPLGSAMGGPPRNTPHIVLAVCNHSCVFSVLIGGGGGVAVCFLVVVVV